MIKMPSKPKQPHLDLLGSIFYNSIVTTTGGCLGGGGEGREGEGEFES